MSFSFVMLQLAKAVSLLFGLLLLYIAFFMYEDQEGKLQNGIEDIWIAVNDKQKASADKTTILSNKVADVVRRVLNRILGTKLISLQMVGVSSSASFASILALGGLLLLVLHHLGYSRHVVVADPLFYPALIIVGLLLLVLSFINLVFAILPSIHPCRFTRILSLKKRSSWPFWSTVSYWVPGTFAERPGLRTVGLDEPDFIASGSPLIALSVCANLQKIPQKMHRYSSARNRFWLVS